MFPAASISLTFAGTLNPSFSRLSLTKGIRNTAKIVTATTDNNIIVILGMPISTDNQLFNCGIVIKNGKILGIVPKTYIAGYGEFYEERWFSSSFDTETKEIITK